VGRNQGLATHHPGSWPGILKEVWLSGRGRWPSIPATDPTISRLRQTASPPQIVGRLLGVPLNYFDLGFGKIENLYLRASSSGRR
jgi:hypothetical protein